MADFLLELFSEEIPARMQPRAADELKRLFTDALAGAGLAARSVDVFATPRRLALIARGLPPATAGLREERRGPRADAPAQAIDGFLKSTGLSRAQLEARDDPKGRFLYAVIEKPGRAASQVLAEIVPALIRGFAWPKSMRWGARSRSEGSLRWVRPLHSIVALLDKEIVALEVDGIGAGRVTRGHRFLSPGAVEIASAEVYAGRLLDAHVILDPSERMRIIAEHAGDAAKAAGLALIEDAGLLAENAGLTEWPIPLLGTFDPGFLDVPPEVIQLTMRANQKYFACRDPQTGRLAPAFVCVANTVAADGGEAIVAGNRKVLAARLSDAKFFWETDKKVRLEDRLPKLADIVFHEKLGTVADKVARVAKLARYLAQYIPGCIPDLAEQAARLAKADLVTGMVGEFPELQGIMGGYYARAEKLPDAVADAIRDHYKPVGQGDAVPTAPVTVAVALADKLDTLACFFLINERPTGSKDPFALRRALLGVIRLVLASGLRMPLLAAFDAALAGRCGGEACDRGAVSGHFAEFVADRLKVQQREAGIRHDLIDAVFALGGEDDLVRLLARVKALQTFVETADGQNLLAGYKRAANILRIEEKKDGRPYSGAVDPQLLVLLEEQALASEIDTVIPEAAAAVAREDFTVAMASLARLRPAVDAFFDKVTVNVDEPDTRANRLRLLSRIRAAVHTVADFSRIEG